MSIYRVIHPGAQAGATLPEERESSDRPDIEFVLLGRCATPRAVLQAVCDADAALCYGMGVDTIDLDAATD